jgi:hypothetical protein
MQVEDVDVVGAELLQRRVDGSEHALVVVALVVDADRGALLVIGGELGSGGLGPGS